MYISTYVLLKSLVEAVEKFCSSSSCSLCNDSIIVVVAVVATATIVVVVVVGGVVTGEMVVDGGVLEGIYSGLHCFSPDSTAQYFIHKRLRY